MQSDELACQSPRRSYADMLSQNCPYRDLEAIPTAGSTQARTLRHQGSEHGIAGQMIVDGLDVGAKIEQPADPGNDGRQQPDIGETDAHSKALAIGQMSYFYASHGPIHLNRAQVTAIFHDFNPRNGPRSQKCEHAVPVIRRAVAKPDGDVLFFFYSSRPRGILSSQCAGRTVED